MTDQLGPLPPGNEPWCFAYTSADMKAYALAEVQRAVAAERERWVKWCANEMNTHRRELDATGHQRHRGAADALERALHACGG